MRRRGEFFRFIVIWAILAAIATPIAIIVLAQDQPPGIATDDAKDQVREWLHATTIPGQPCPCHQDIGALSSTRAQPPIPSSGMSSISDCVLSAGPRSIDLIKGFLYAWSGGGVAALRQLRGGSMMSLQQLQHLPEADRTSMVSVLGGFHLWWSGNVQVGVPRASQRLLAFLALYGGVANRAIVAGTLWPDATESHAYSNLRSALARVERTCRKALQATRLEVGLAEGVTVDIRHSQQLARRLLDPAMTPEQSDLGAAAFETLSRDLLPGWYDDWVLIEAEDWRQLRLHALEALAARLTAAGRWGEAAHAASAAVRAEPLRESAHAALIQVHLAEGNQSEAVREFTRYRALLHAELGLEPTPRLRRLLHGLPSR